MIIALSIIFLIIGLNLWFVLGKDKKVVPVVSFYPPKDLSLPEASIIYNEQTAPEIRIKSVSCKTREEGRYLIFNDRKELISEAYALWLLRKKFLKIKKPFYTFETVPLSTQEEFNKMTELEKACYDIFDAIRIETDRFSLFNGLPTLKKALKNWNNLLKKYSKKYLDQGNRFLSLLFFIFSVLLLTFSLGNILVGACIYIFLIVIVSLISIIKYKKYLFILYFLFSVFIGFFSYNMAIEFSTNIADTLITVISATILAICYCNLSKRTPLGNKYYGELLGFKDFLQKVEIPQLNELMQKDTDYFLKILPYAIELGIIHKDYRKELYQYLYQCSEDQASAFVAIRKNSLEKKGQ